MLHRLEEWVTGAKSDIPKLLKEAACIVRSILHGSELEDVLEQTSDKKARLSIYAIDKYDYLFRSIPSFVCQRVVIHYLFTGCLQNGPSGCKRKEA